MFGFLREWIHRSEQDVGMKHESNHVTNTISDSDHLDLHIKSLREGSEWALSWVYQYVANKDDELVRRAAVAVAEEEAVEEVKEEKKGVDLSALSDEEQAAVREFVTKIDVMNSEQVLNYGSAAQKNIAEFSENTLESVRTKDLGEVGSMLSDLVVELKGLNFSEEEKKGLKGSDSPERWNLTHPEDINSGREELLRMRWSQ